MKIEDKHLQSPGGPLAYDNWLAALNYKPSIITYEYPLLTDARVSGEITEGFGPYQFLNLIPLVDRPGFVRPAIILRAKLHVEYATPEFNITDSERYHGGSLADEIAALTSLSLGTRLKPGGVTRRFETYGDPLGKPIAWDSHPDPVVIIRSYSLILPSVIGHHALDPLKNLNLLNLLPNLTPSDAIALVRAARLYQDALWIAESEPSLSWVMLVSAIEAAANHWRSISDSPLERLRNSKPELVAFLDSTGVDNISSNVAMYIVDSLGSTKKFVDFVITFLPPPPSNRPPKWGQISWDGKNMRRIMRLIYGYRSDALHGGRPFPAPMCDPPFRHRDWKAYAEKPFGLAQSRNGGTWLAKDTPTLLHTFEYIVRNSLLIWWRSMIPNIQE